MSRSNPVSQTPHPCQRWFEWNGDSKGGFLSYWDKNAKGADGRPGVNVAVPLPVTFLLLDELAVVKGWDKKHDCGITSNEVQDTRSEVMVVKSWDGGVIASGFYSAIKDAVGMRGGRYTTNCYVAFRPDKASPLALGSIQFSGSALQHWMEFKKTCPVRRIGKDDIKEFYLQAVRITSYKEGKNGGIVYRTPMFQLQPCSDQTNAEAKAVEVGLQDYLTQYFARTKSQQAAQSPATPAQQEQPQSHEQEQPPVNHDFEPEPEAPPADDSDAPF